MTLDEKHDIIYEVIEESISEIEKTINEVVNSDEFKMELYEKLKKRGVEIKFKDNKHTKLIGNIEMDKYDVYFGEDLHESIKEDLIIL